MSDAKQTLKQKAVHEVKGYLVISFYLFVVFSLFVIYTSVILAEHHIDFALHGFALINALALAKVILIAQELHLFDWFRDAPLIYPTLLKSFVFTIVLACFKIAEEAVIGGFHRKSFHESTDVIAGASWKGDLTLVFLLFVVLIPFFGFTELRRVFGEDRMVGVFFRSRHLLNLPPTG
jgi:cytochrome c oxidase subunit IV